MYAILLFQTIAAISSVLSLKLKVLLSAIENMRKYALSLFERFKSTIKDIKLIKGLKNPRCPFQVIRMAHNGLAYTVY